MVIDACRVHLRGCCGDSLDNLKGPNYHVGLNNFLQTISIQQL